MGQHFGEEAACFTSSLVRSGFGTDSQDRGTGCYEFRCEADPAYPGGVLAVRTPDGTWHSCADSQTLTATDFTGTLSCPSDWSMLCIDPSLFLPPDVDECQNRTHNCDALAGCVNTDGSFTCECTAGFSGIGTMDTCVDVNECGGQNNCDENAVCNNTAGSFTCACESGFTGDGTTCDDVDECTGGGVDCSQQPDFVCINTPGSFECGCAAGFVQGGGVCVDADECDLGTDNCHASATCSNVDSSFTCECVVGYAGSGTTCADVNECSTGAHTCQTAETCTNTAGSFTCSTETPPTTGTSNAVHMVVTLPYTVDTFTVALQTSFRRAVASVAGVAIEDVVINSVTAAGRRAGRVLSETEVDVDVSVKVASAAAAEQLVSSGSLNLASLNTALGEQGVQPITAVKTAPAPTEIVVDGGSSHGFVLAPLSMTAGAVAAGLCVLAADSVGRL